MSAAKKKRPAPQMTVTGTAELVLTPQIRRFRGRLYLGAAALVGLLVLAALMAVRYLSVVEPMLAAEGQNAARAIVYEVPAGKEIHIPIEPHTDLLRFVVHAYGKSDMALSPHVAKLSLDIRGDKRKRKEEIRAELPGLRSRVTPESAQTAVGDPTPFEVDVHDAGVGELVVKLTEISGADGMLVRAYRREQLGEGETALRDTALDREKKNELAQWTWELGWDELSPPERTALLQARWRRIGSVRGGFGDLKSTTIAISPAPNRESPPSREELLGRVALRGDERVAMIMHSGVKVRFLSDEATVLTATVRDLDNQTVTKSAAGSLDIGPYEGARSIELGAARDVLLEVRSANANETEWLGWSSVWRVLPARPVVIDSPDLDRVVRVSVRRPMPRTDPGMTKLDVKVEFSNGMIFRWNADKPRSRVERYEDFDSPEAPSERAAFYLAVPRGSRARILPGDSAPLDISLAELDTTVPPLPLAQRAPELPPPVIIAETDDAKTAWVPRRPSNVSAFDEASRKVVRTAHWYAPAPPPPPAGTLALAHAKHTDIDRTVRGDKIFDGVTKSFELESDSRRPLYVPIVTMFDSEALVTVRVERDPAAHEPGKMQPGLYSRWTLPRTIAVGPNESRATFVIGDDIPAAQNQSQGQGNAKLRLRIIPDSKPAKGGHQLVLLPWQTNRAVGPRWLNGAFEE